MPLGVLWQWFREDGVYHHFLIRRILIVLFVVYSIPLAAEPLYFTLQNRNGPAIALVRVTPSSEFSKREGQPEGRNESSLIAEPRSEAKAKALGLQVIDVPLAEGESHLSIELLQLLETIIENNNLNYQSGNGCTPVKCLVIFLTCLTGGHGWPLMPYRSWQAIIPIAPDPDAPSPVQSSSHKLNPRLNRIKRIPGIQFKLKGLFHPHGGYEDKAYYEISLSNTHGCMEGIASRILAVELNFLTEEVDPAPWQSYQLGEIPMHIINY